jgi:beta-lactamase regulating signal transducer with metallopeptidase domain/HEAT repeat protein
MPTSLLSDVGAHPAWNVPMAVLLLKATIILIAALGVTLVMQRASAGARHLVWLVALGTLLLVPAVATWAPFRVAILPPARAVTAAPSPDAGSVEATAAVPSAGPPAQAAAPRVTALPGAPSTTVTATVSAPFAGMSIVSMLAALWAAVVLAIAGSLAWSALAVRRIVRQARPLDTADWTTPLFEVADRLGLDEAPALLRSEEARMPFACGVLHATIVLPAECDDWTLDRRRAVLLHELAHVRRHDLIGHTLGRLACAVYWFHPLVWTAAKRLRAESERACDDLALACGTRATDYAEHLLEIVTSVRRDATPSVALAMARRKEFEGRMLAILDPELRHSSPNRMQSAALIASLAIMSLVVGAAAPARRLSPPQVVEQQSARADSIARADSASRRSDAAAQSRQAQSPEYQNDFSGAPRTNYERRRNREQQTNVQQRVSQRTSTTISEAISNATASAIATASGEGAEALRRMIASGAVPNAQVRADDRPVLLAKILRTDSSAELRRIAAWGLSEYADTQVATDALSEAVRKDKDVDVREMAAWALAEGSERSAAVSDALVAALKDPSEKVRATAAWALGEVGSRSAVAALVSALDDQSSDVKRRAIWALGEIGPKQAPKPLVAMLKDKDVETRELVAWALYEIEDPDAAPALEAALKAESNKDLQISYIRALAAMGEKSVDALRGLLESSDPRVKTMAVKALAGGQADGPWPWPWPEPRPYP